jgi:N utilization substance protein B
VVANPRDIRELALQALYQLDARGGDDSELNEIQAEHGLANAERAAAFDLARAAYADRERADAMASELAPKWPTTRQPAIDRNLIRLAWCEMTTAHAPAKVAVNEAIELAKRYSTDKSPAFINGVLDKMMKRLPPPEAQAPAEPSTGDAWLDDALKVNHQSPNPNHE